MKGKTRCWKGPDNGISVIDANGKLVPQMMKILDIMKRNNLVLATGHVSKPEVYADAGEALRQHINVIITHPLAGPAGPLITIDEAKELAGMGAYIECTFAECMPPMLISPENMVGYIKRIGSEHCVLALTSGRISTRLPPKDFT